MIVILGRPGLGPAEGGVRTAGTQAVAPLGGLAARVAVEAASRGARVELAGSIGDDAAGDAVAVALGRAGVGHAALLRDPAGATATEGIVSGGAPPRLDAGDVELALRYLSECRVLVLADPLDDAAAGAAMDAAGYHGAPVIAVVDAGDAVSPALERGAIVLAAPEPDADDDGDGPARFAGFLAGFAMALADGVPAREAMARAASGGGWERAPAG